MTTQMNDARQLTVEQASAVAAWCNGRLVEEIDPFDESKRFPGLNVLCGAEMKRASLGDYVVHNSDGTFDVMGPLEYHAMFSS